jgi:hypothetical protein
MDTPPEKPRKGKKLLVASIGVATVSFMNLQTGCEDSDDGQLTNVANLIGIPIDSFHDPSLARDAALDAALDAFSPVVISGNLLPPITATANLLAPPADASFMDAIVTSGNLLPPPDAAADAASDAALDASHDAAAKDAAAPKDAKADTGLPSSGNLLPIPPNGSR